MKVRVSGTGRKAPEFIGRAPDQWAYTRGARPHFVAPGNPVLHAHIESFHGRSRDECLNAPWFATLADAHRIIEAWRQDHNAVRPHSDLGSLTPEEFEQRTLNAAEPIGFSFQVAEGWGAGQGDFHCSAEAAMVPV